DKSKSLLRETGGGISLFVVVLGSTILTVEMGAILSTLVEAHQYLSNKGCREVGFIR
ncbi:MAG: hypothetical protein RL450_951, partial [Actinomycetota bacterium]